MSNAYYRSPEWMWQNVLLPNFLYYLGVLIRAKWLILSVTLVSALIGMSYAITATNVYEASVVVMAVDRKGGGGPVISSITRAADLFGLGGGLADAFGAGSSANQRTALVILRSRTFMNRFARKHQIYLDGFDGDGSDPDAIGDTPPLQYAAQTLHRTYREFRKRLSVDVKGLMRKLYKPHNFDRDTRLRDSPTRDSPPFDRDARLRDSPASNGYVPGHEEFRESIAIERKPRQGLLHLKVRWRDPVVAAELANALVAELNSALRETAIGQSRERIAYLNRELDKTSVIPLRQSIHRLIEAETRTIMIAETRGDYVFRVIDPAIPADPDNPIRPKRRLMIRTTTLMGFAIAVFAAILLDHARILRGAGRG